MTQWQANINQLFTQGTTRRIYPMRIGTSKPFHRFTLQQSPICFNVHGDKTTKLLQAKKDVTSISAFS